MPTFLSDDVEIAYDDEGEGAPILLIHGFASNARVNWHDPGWTRALTAAGRRVIALDNRGHGRSGKLYDPARYTAAIMAEDALRLLDHLGIARADAMGYSMGTRIAALFAIAHPARLRRAVFGGLAANMVHGVEGAEAIARGLEAPSLAEVTEPEPRAFRKFAEQTGSDLKALAACMRASRQKIPAEDLACIAVPVLVVAGELDDISGAVQPLVNNIPGSRGVVLPRRNHMNAVGDRGFKEAVLSFLGSG